jgi:hypothetical protein
MWPTLAEKFLLALIDANPIEREPWEPPALTRQERLNSLLEILFDVPATADNRPPMNDLADQMKLARIRFQAEMEKNFTEEMFAEAVPAVKVPKFPKHVPDNPNDPSKRDSRMGRLRGKYYADSFQDYAWWVTTFGEHEEERDMMVDLVQLQEILRRWNIELRLDPAALGLGSLIRG